MREDPILTREYVNENLKIDLSQEQYDDLVMIDLTHKSVVFAILQVLKVLQLI